MNQPSPTQTPCVVRITFQRIQQFLFAVPRLKAMIGANALLGETIRNELTELAQNSPGIKRLSWPGSKTLNSNVVDPLSDQEIASQYQDDPPTLYAKGITSRDGGHFHAVFQTRASAETFLRQAQALIENRLPGVKINASIGEPGQTARPWNQPDACGEQNPFLPYFQICQDTGNRLANHHRSNQSPPFVSSLVEQLEEKGDEFYKNNTKEIIGLLRAARKLPSLDYEPRMPDDLKELAGSNGYIAVIHADGNGMGVRRECFAGNNETTAARLDAFIEQEARNEVFFHAMRVAVRASVIEALRQTFTPEVLQSSYELPYQLLMLGGDDLLLVTRPEHAFPFIIHYAEALQNKPVPYKDGQTRPISIGAGIAIAHHKLPFYRLYDLAEQLAASAKKLYRAQGPGHGVHTPPERSVVDWMVATGSWLDDVETARTRHDLSRDGRYCISAKPYFVLPATDHDSFCLKTLWDKATDLVGQYTTDEIQAKDDREKVARSRMKRILRHVQRTVVDAHNKEKGDLLYTKEGGLPKELTTGLFPEATLWHQIDGGWLTQYRDFMELVEIHYLGRKKKSEDAQRLGKDREQANGQ